MKKEHELAGIEILRFLCAFGVLVWHYQHFFFPGTWDPALGATLRPTEPLYPVLSFFYQNGSLAVPFFWVISGYIFYWNYSNSIKTGAVTSYEFVVRRFSRLYPLHVATLIVVAVGQFAYYRSHGTTFIYSWNKPFWFASQLLFVTNWFTRQPETFNGPIWSVSIEILIYMLFFAIARAFGSRALVAALVAVACAVLNDLHTFINPAVFACGMYFFAGGVAQRLSARPGAFLIAGCAAIATASTIRFGHYGGNAASLLLLATSSVILMARLGQTALRVPFSRLAFLGNATYSSYLLHFPIQLLVVIVVDALAWQRNVFYSPRAVVAFLATVVGLSLVVHRYFEKPAQSALRALAMPYATRLRISFGSTRKAAERTTTGRRC